MTLSLDGEGGIEFFAELAQWEQWNASKKAPSKSKTAEPQRETGSSKKKLSYLEAREYEQIEDRVAKAEEVLDAKRQQLEHPDLVSNPTRLMQATAEIDAAQDEVDKLYARWAELEAKKG